MDKLAGVVIKILLGSTLLALGIKWGGTWLPVSPTPGTVMVLVLLPTVAMAIALSLRSWDSQA